jgi:trigger factor
MQVTETLSEGLKRAYTVVVPSADIERRRARRLSELGRTVQLPGFRPGKVPVSVVKQRFGNAVNAEVLQESVEEATRQVLDERKLRSAGQPRVEVVTLAEASDLEFKVELELLPEFELPDLGALALTRLKAMPDDEVIERSLNELARRQRTFEDVEARPAEKGEVLTIDYAGKVDDKPFPGGTGKDVDVEVAGPGFIPGFTDQLEGLRPGETRSIEVTFPADYPAAEVAGKPAQFEVTAKRLRRAIVPPVDEGLAEKLGFDGGLAELRETIRGQVQREYDALSRMRLKRELLDTLAAGATFPVPAGLLEAEFNAIWQRVEADRKAGRVDEDDAGKDEATLQADYRAIAERRVRLGLLLAEIGRGAGITVNQDELQRAMRMEAARYPGQEQQVMDLFRRNPQAAESLRAPIFEDKVIDHILGRAQVGEREVTLAELSAEPPAPLPSATASAGQVAGGEAETGSAAATDPS